MLKAESKTLYAILNSLITVVLAAFIGGRGAAMLVFSVYLLAIHLRQKLDNGPTNAILVSFLIHCSWIGIICCLIIPLIKNIDMAPINYLFTGATTKSFSLGDSNTMAATGRDLSVFGASFSILLPSLAVLPMMFRNRKKNLNKSIGSHEQFLNIGIAVGVFAVIKATDAWNALAPVMSGDGRNNYLLTYAARSSAFKPSTFIDVGILPNAIAGLVSASNGANGVNKISDVWAIAFVYVLAAGFIGTAVVAYIREKIKKESKLIILFLVFGSSLIVVNPIALSFCLNDGFFSLYFSLSIACSLLAISQSSQMNRWTLIGLVAGLLALMMCYVILVPSLVAGLFVFLIAKLPRNEKIKIAQIILFPVGVLFVLAFSVAGKRIWQTYIEKALLPGAVTPIDPKILITCIIVLIFFAIYSKHAIRWNAVAVAVIGVISLMQYSIIEIAAGQFLSDADSYYGTKIITATTFIVATFTTAIFVITFIRRSKIDGISKIVKVSVFSTVLFFVGSEMMAYGYKLPNALPRISEGWGYTSAEEISVAVNHWGGPPFLFLEYSKSLEISAGTWRAETQSANDRLLNFWSPIFWNIDERSSRELYQWIYGQWNPVDLETMCPILVAPIKVIITRSSTLEGRLQAVCEAVPRVSLQQ